MITESELTVHTPKGTRVEVSALEGYVLTQHRPFECRVKCECGTCNGTTRKHIGTLRETVYWADNSIEAFIDCEDGETRIHRFTPPSGDACF